MENYNISHALSINVFKLEMAFPLGSRTSLLVTLFFHLKILSDFRCKNLMYNLLYMPVCAFLV